MKRSPLLIFLLVVVALALPGAASAAEPKACPANLTVAGLALSGETCTDLGNGETEIDHPVLLSNKVVEIQGKMVLDVAHDHLRQKTVLVPLPLAVKDASGAPTTVLAGTLEVGNFRVCDLGKPFAPVGGGPPAVSIDGERVNTFDRLDIQSAQINCRIAPAVKVGEPALKLAVKLLKSSVELKQAFAVDENGTQVALPSTFGLDEQRGGRIFGNFTVRVALVTKEHDLRLALTAEVSRDKGFRPVSVGVEYTGQVAVLPGVTIRDPGVSFDPLNDTYGGRLRLSYPPGLNTRGVDLLVQDGELKRIGFDLGVPPPGIPIGPLNFDTIGMSFQRGGSTRVGTFGQTTTSPAQFQGRTSFTAGPTVPLPGGKSFKALVGDVDLTIQGPAIQLDGALTGINNLIRLGGARVLVARNPFRFEADATLAFPSQTNAIVRGKVFIGATSNAFTGLGTFNVQVPESIPVIGGQTLGGFAGVVSNKAVAGTVVVDPPLLKPRTVGVAFKYGAGFDIIDSITPFITVTPSRSIASASAAGGVKRVTFRNPRARKDVLIQLTGQAVRGVSIKGPHGRRLHATRAGRGLLAVPRLRAGRYTVTGRGIAKVQLQQVEDTPYLDPAPGIGTRPHAPVTAGTPVHVCWDIKHAPKGAVVDLFEDTNGRAATGREIAAGVPAKGCHDVATSDWEPGRHWVYGVVRVGKAPLSIRYWPIGITVTDPTRLGAPANLVAAPTHDGATLTWNPVEGASGYVVTATPVHPQDAPVQRANVLDPSAELSLRGAARWNVSVQAVDATGVIGNASAVV
jgi:hypothetical protein